MFFYHQIIIKLKVEIYNGTHSSLADQSAV